MCFPMDLEPLLSDGEVEELAYSDATVRHLCEAIQASNDALEELRGYSVEDLVENPATVEVEDLAATDTYRATLQGNAALYAALNNRLASLALEEGKDPEAVVCHLPDDRENGGVEA